MIKKGLFDRFINPMISESVEEMAVRTGDINQLNIKDETEITPEMRESVTKDVEYLKNVYENTINPESLGSMAIEQGYNNVYNALMKLGYRRTISKTAAQEMNANSIDVIKVSPNKDYITRDAEGRINNKGFLERPTSEIPDERGEDYKFFDDNTDTDEFRYGFGYSQGKLPIFKLSNIKCVIISPNPVKIDNNGKVMDADKISYAYIGETGRVGGKIQTIDTTDFNDSFIYTGKTTNQTLKDVNGNEYNITVPIFRELQGENDLRALAPKKQTEQGLSDREMNQLKQKISSDEYWNKNYGDYDYFISSNKNQKTNRANPIDYEDYVKTEDGIIKCVRLSVSTHKIQTTKKYIKAFYEMRKIILYIEGLILNEKPASLAEEGKEQFINTIDNMINWFNSQLNTNLYNTTIKVKNSYPIKYGYDEDIASLKCIMQLCHDLKILDKGMTLGMLDKYDVMDRYKQAGYSDLKIKQAMQGLMPLKNAEEEQDRIFAFIEDFLNAYLGNKWRNAYKIAIKYYNATTKNQTSKISNKVKVCKWCEQQLKNFKELVLNPDVNTYAKVCNIAGFPARNELTKQYNDYREVYESLRRELSKWL